MLTGAHLAHADDLSRWQVTEVADDRYLVRAADLTAWYGSVESPGSDVLAEARRDFGDMILTDAIAEAHPLPPPAD